MNEPKYIDKIKKVQENILAFLETEDNDEENYQNLQLLISDYKVHDDIHLFKSFLYLVLKISNNHKRGPHFFNKIEKIFDLFKEDIKKKFSNFEIFKIFESNKKILLYLIEEKIMVMDETIVKIIIKEYKYILSKYPQYFQPEIQPFIKEKWFPKQRKNYERIEWIDEINEEIPDNFYDNRKIGENNDSICELIRNDRIEDFIIHINRYNTSNNTRINTSIYETNTFLIKNQPILIEYAAFFGSTQIFNYLRLNGAEIHNNTIWLFAIHGDDPQIIEYLKEIKIEPDDDTYIDYYIHSIMCHHNTIANYIHENYSKNTDEVLDLVIMKCLKYYNFAFIPMNYDFSKMIFWLCKYDYYLIIRELIKNKDIDINKEYIL